MMRFEAKPSPPVRRFIKLSLSVDLRFVRPSAAKLARDAADRARKSCGCKEPAKILV
jgi:hypothetical protein